MKKILCLVLAMVMTLSLTACQVIDDGRVRIRLSTNLTQESVTGQALEKFKEDISAKTDGRIYCDVYYSSVLGANNSVMEMMAEGDVEMMTVNPVTFETQVPMLATLDQYYMFDDLDHVHRFFEGEGGQAIFDSWQDIGLQGLEIFALGFRELTNSKRPVSTLKDVKGLSIRGYSPIQIAAWKSVGAGPTSVDWNELFVSMQQGLLDGQEAALTTISDFSFYEVQPELTLTDHVFSCDMLLTSTKWLESLDPADRELIEETMHEAYLWHKDTYQKDLENMLDKFENDYHVRITELDPEVKAEFAERMSAASTKEILKICDQETYDRIQAFVEETRD